MGCVVVWDLYKFRKPNWSRLKEKTNKHGNKLTPTRHKKSKKFDLVCCALFLVKQVCALRHILLVNYVLINYSWSCNPDHWHTHSDITMHDTILWWQSTHGLKSNLCRVGEQPKIEVQLNSITPNKVLSPSQYILHRLQHRHYTHTQYTTIILNNSRQIIDHFMWRKFQLFSLFLFPFFSLYKTIITLILKQASKKWSYRAKKCSTLN